MKNRLTNYNFWISLVSAALLILQAFNIEFDIAYINEISTAVLGLLVVIGIISDPTKIYLKQEESKDKKVATVISETAVEETATETEQELSETEITQEAVEIIPIDEKVENIDDTDKNDFKILVDKITMDLEQNMKTISNIQQSILEKLNKTAEKTEAEITTDEKIEVIGTNENNCLNIVNN